MKAKTMSQVSKVMAVVFVVTMFVLKAVFEWVVTAQEIALIGGFILLSFSPVDVSIWLEKFFKR